MEDKFEIAENEGRAKALKVLNQISTIFDDDFDDYRVIPTDSKCAWDFEIRDNDFNSLIGIIEAKDRKFPSTDPRLISQGCQLEDLKYNALYKEADRRMIPAFYLATFSDNQYRIWSVCDTPVTDDTRMCNKTTAVLERKVEKHCYYFPMDKAVRKGTIII